MNAEKTTPLEVNGLTVTVDKMIFVSADNDYAVVRAFRNDNPDMEIVLQGMFGRVTEGEHFVVSGFWKQTPRGKQLYCVEIGLAENSGDVLKDYLESGSINGITPSQGKRLWEAFKGDLPYVLADTPARVLEVKGFSQAKLEKLLESWNVFSGKRSVQVALVKLGIKLGTANRIIDHYGNPRLAWEKVQTDPYALAWEIKGIGFIEADSIALKLGIEENDDIRIEGALGYALYLGKKNGHCFQPPAIIHSAITKSKDFAGLEKTSPETVHACIKKLAEKDKIIIKEEKLYLPEVYKAQKTVEAKVLDLADTEWLYDDLEQRVRRCIRKFGLDLDALQRDAILHSCTEGICVITGGPGTGKTTIIKGIIEALDGEKIALCAPTGRAAKKMAEATGHEAFTIHRLLHFHPPGEYEYHSGNPLPYDVVIVDEASMLDIFLAADLLSAISEDTRLVLVGDVDQLPSVGPGAVFKDIINSNVCHVSRLSEIYRQSNGSYISINAAFIKAGKSNALNLTNRTDDFFFMEVPESADKAQAYLKRLGNAIDRLFVLKYTLENILILTPMNVGGLGVHSLNAFLQNKLNPNGREVYKGRKFSYRVGDRILQCMNDYEKDVFNGDIGVIHGPLPGGGLRVRYPDKDVAYLKEDVVNLSLAYAMTIHKAQGSECPVVIQLISTSHYTMLKRSILYTGVTRAKRMCVLIGERRALQMAISKDDANERKTDLLSGFVAGYGDLGAAA